MQNDEPLDLPQIQNGSQQTPGASDLYATDLTLDDQPTLPPGLSQAIAQLPAEANDLDLIEKEWVLKAKEIVLHTQDDPYAQQTAISHMKTEYMKKRFNRDIKVSGG